MSGTPVWITRNAFGSSVYIGSSQPDWSWDRLGWDHEHLLTTVPADKFASATGINVAPGEVLTCRLNIKIIARAIR